jgi:hypothetical protein
MDYDSLAEVLAEQDGVISRRQLLDLGATDNDIERMLRRRAMARVHDGVYVDHTGRPTWTQRAWAAVLYYWPAALSGRSSLRAFGIRHNGGGDSDDAPIEVAVDGTRSVARLRGVRVSRVNGFHHLAQKHLSPPRLRLEHALVTVASQASDESAAVAVLGDACQTGRTTAGRLLDAVKSRPRLRLRRLLLEILVDVAEGAYSVLERHYLTRVERPHGLPTGRRQRRVKPGKTVAFRDVEYAGLGVVMELDGRLGHEAANDRWADLDRDLESALNGEVTLRAGWKQVLSPCRLAAAVARILLARGWQGRPRACGPGCPAGRLS